jgi:hypothetical protein
MAADQISEEEFERWIPVKAAASEVGAASEDAQEILKARIRSGAIKITARVAVDFDRGHRIERRFFLIDEVRWIGTPDDRFWEVGDHTLRERLGPSFADGTRVVVEFHGIRLDPEGLDALRRDLGIHQEKSAEARLAEALASSELARAVESSRPARRQAIAGLEPDSVRRRSTGAKARKKPRNIVSDAEVKAWHAALSEEDQARGWRWLYHEAKRHFRPRRVLKKHVLGLVEGRPPGRPRMS